MIKYDKKFNNDSLLLFGIHPQSDLARGKKYNFVLIYRKLKAYVISPHTTENLLTNLYHHKQTK